MRKQVVLTLTFVSLLAYISNAQLVNDLYKIYNPVSQSAVAQDTSIYSPFGIIKPGKPQYNLSFGASYTSFGRGMGYSSSTVSPTVAFATSEKTQFVVGGSFSMTNPNNMPPTVGSNGKMQQNLGNPAQVFAYGQYQFNNRFSVYAMGSFSKNQLVISPFQPGLGTADYQQLGVGLNYKIGRNTTIGASFNYGMGNGLMGLSPFDYSPLGPIFP
jgi:hypothetical protein